MAVAAICPEHVIMAAVMRQRKASLPALPWREWLDRHFAAYTPAPFGDRHLRFWEWLTALEPDVRPRPRVEAWPRGGGKSSTIELGCAYLGSRQNPSRHYVLYVSKTQSQANKHVQAIAAMLEKVGVKRALNEYGSSKGWRHEEIRTANGFNVTAFGLDSGMRGVRLDEYRPSVIIMDDIDDRLDSEETLRKKIDVLTTTILPSGSSNCAVIVVQNKIHDDSIVSRLCDGRADFLHDREPATVEPAVRDLQVERTIDDDGMPRYVITGGAATWEGQPLETCEQQINSWGLTAFLREAQHEVDEHEGGLWDRARDIDPFRVFAHPALDRIVVAVDPNASEGGDEAGIVVAGVSNWYRDVWHAEAHGYVLADLTVSGGPKSWAEASVAAYNVYQADELVAEANNGGDMVAITIGTVPGAPRVTLIHASRGKRTRAEPVHKLYEDGRGHHVGTFPELEHELCRWVPGAGSSPNRLDSCVWAYTTLMLKQSNRVTDTSAFTPVPESRQDRARRYRGMKR